MKHLTPTLLLALVCFSVCHATGEEKRVVYEYASLSVKGLTAGDRDEDDFRWTFPDEAGRMDFVFKTNRAAIAEYFNLGEEEAITVVPAILNRISAMGWKLEAVHHVPSYERIVSNTTIRTPFHTDYHFVRVKHSEQDGGGPAAIRPESDSEGGDKPQPEAGARPR